MSDVVICQVEIERTILKDGPAYNEIVAVPGRMLVKADSHAVATRRVVHVDIFRFMENTLALVRRLLRAREAARRTLLGPRVRSRGHGTQRSERILHFQGQARVVGLALADTRST